MTETDRSFRSVVDMFHHRVASTPDAEALSGRSRPGTGWYTLTWGDLGERARAVACGLLDLGIAKGQRVAILAASSPEWIAVDMGILAAAGATTTVYTSNTPEECAHILSDSGSVLCFAENPEQAEKLLQVRGELPGLRRVILMTGSLDDRDLSRRGGDGWIVTLDRLVEAGRAWDESNPDGYDRVAGGVGPDDLATLIYTSGTTGRPKGVELTHGNWVYETEAIEEISVIREDDTVFLFLPLAHSFAKIIETAQIRLGCPMAVDADLDELIDNVATARPTVMPAVPRIFEKVYNRVVEGAREAGGLKQRIFDWALRVGRKVSELRQRGKDASGLLALQHRLADRLVFSKLKARFGGRIRLFISGGAPLSREIAEFFHASDMLVIEGYGLTETSAASVVNRPESFKFGTVGLPVPGTEVEIAEDGEVLIRGPGVMRGYHGQAGETAATVDEEGWLHSGDIGEIDGEGFLTITDRKKDVIVTAGGKNIAPQYIENLLKTQSAYVSQVVMLGDRRPYCVALVTIDEDAVGEWAKERGIEWDGYGDLASKPEVEELIWGEVERLNQRLASYETIKKIHLLERDFAQETGELTPKMSVKRKVVERTWGDVLERMYEEDR